MSSKPTYEELEKRVRELEQTGSELKHNNKTLREREKHFHGLVSGMVNGFALHEIIVDSNGKPKDYRFLEVNSAFEEITGLQRESILGKTVLDVLPNTETYWIETFGKVALEGEDHRFENYSQELGKYFEVLAYSPSKNMFATVFTDTTDRRLTEKKLKEYEKENMVMLNNLLIGFVVHAPDTKVIFCNRKALEILGLTEEQMLGKEATDPRWSFVYEDLSTMKVEDYPVSKVLSTKKPFHDYVVGIRRPDREYITWVIVNAIPVLSENNEVEKVAVNFIDFTARKQAEKRLQRNETLLNTTQQLAKIGGWEIDLRKGITYWTDEVYRIHDLQPGQFASLEKDEPNLSSDHQSDEFTSIDEAIKLSAECYNPEDRAVIVEAFRKCVEQGLSYDLEFPFCTTKGRRIWIRTITNPVMEDGKIIKVVGNFMDITERKRAEKEKLSFERQMQEAQKLESLGVLAGGIAHDFNNLLMVILGNADLALHNLSPMSPARRNVQEVEKASLRAAELANQMLAYSGKGKFVIESIDLNEFVEETTHLLEVSISKKAVLKYNLADNLPAIDGDITQIRQVLMNLITNASEAIGDKSGVISLSTGAMDCDRAYLDSIDEVVQTAMGETLEEGGYTYLEVADTGCGMDADTVDKIFDPFFTTKFSGRGLGMSAVLGIMRGHKGLLRIDSEVGKGTTFKVLFPSIGLPDSNFSIQKNEDAEVEDWRGTGTILVVDDEGSICAVCRQMLEDWGFDVLTAPDGREALKVFLEHNDKIVCVLIDLTMPHMDGEESFRELRRIDPAVTVILCSGYNEQEATQRFTGTGLAGFIQKPYQLAALRKKIMEVLRDDQT